MRQLRIRAGQRRSGVRGPAHVQARVRQVRATMASHRSPKRPGDDLHVRVNWVNGTVDGNGNPLVWPFRMQFRVFHVQPLIADREVLDSGWKNLGTTKTGNVETTHTFFGGVDFEGILKVEVRLEAQDPQNASSWIRLITDESHEEAWDVEEEPPDPSASITSIDASQPRRASHHQARPVTGLTMPEVEAGPRAIGDPRDYRTALVEQARPPGGFDFPEPEAPPRRLRRVGEFEQRGQRRIGLADMDPWV